MVRANALICFSLVGSGKDETGPSARNLATDVTLSGDSAPRTASGDPHSDQELPVKTIVGEYEIECVVGRGGFGTVYRAMQPVIGKRVAIKVLSRRYSADDEMVSRFKAEARAVNQIRHRNIIDIFSFGQLSDGRQYYVMEHLEGEPLDQYVAEHGPLSLDQALPILRAVARALDAAHAKGIAHRDLKPENVFLARDDEGGLFPKLLDFGIAKLNASDEAVSHRTHTGVPLGTPYYMSPEQCRGQNVDQRTDLYAFGVLCYRLLTGTFPFEGTMVDILHQHMYDEPPPPSSKKPELPSAVDAAVAWMMRKDPSQRPRSVIAAVVALQDDKTPTPMISSLDSTAKVARRRPAWIVPAIGAAAIALGTIIYLATRGPSEHRTVEPSPPLAVAPPAPDAALPVVTIVDAAVARSSRVMINVTGVPDGTEVAIGKSVVGTAPGPVQLDRSSEPVVLMFRAEGYALFSQQVTPDRDQPLALKLKRRTSTRPTSSTTPTTTDDDVIHVFGPETKKK